MLLIEFLLSRKELLIHDGGRNSPGPSREFIRREGRGDETSHTRKMTDRYRVRSSKKSD
jgi:hypothetical protein